ncbi:MAG: GNAT family N-acetyltransferase [Actinomycetia bacterium]|nr:GNAT family N-acetyltransferase [Actinomycetes bacterium]
MISPVTLADGAIVRGARADDLPAARELEAAREGEDDAVDLELVGHTPGACGGMAVIERDGEILSIATLLAERVRFGGTTLSAGQVEMVATASSAEGRGYARALMNWCHELSTSRGDALQVMIGIPNFYRQFGYHYSIPMHPWTQAKQAVAPPTDVTVRRATIDDLDDLGRLQDAAQSHYDVAMPHSADCWGWILQHPSSVQHLASDSAGASAGVARMFDDGDGSVDVGELTASTPAATAALIAHAQALAGADRTVRVSHRPHVPGLADLLGTPERREWYYARIPDPAALFDALAPELLRRLHEMGREAGELLISFYRSHVRLAWNSDRLEVTKGGPLQAPVSAGGSGVPLDALPALLFGGGAAAIDQRFPDALLGRQEDLMRQLFPPQRADLLTFYLPS